MMTLYYVDYYKDLCNTYTVYAVAPADRDRFRRRFPDAERVSRATAIRLGWTRVREAKRDGEFWPAGFAGSPAEDTLESHLDACRRHTKDTLDGLDGIYEAIADMERENARRDEAEARAATAWDLERRRSLDARCDLARGEG